MSRETDPISVLIDAKLPKQPNTSHARPSIIKVNDSQRSENKQAYEPKILSIGPYHHGKPNLRQMEAYKLGYVQQLLSRVEKSVDEFISVIRELEDEAQRFYAEKISLSIEFVEMLFVDSCFIIEFLMNWNNSQPSNQNDTSMDVKWLHKNIARDLILFENQVPFFVLIELCKITKEDLLALALNLCDVMPDWSSTANYTGISLDRVIHLLDFVHKVWCSSFVPAPPDLEHGDSKSFIKCATELQYNGIKFEKDTRENHSWLDITFENGELKIPPLTVTDNTESIFRNLIAYEQYETNPEYRRCTSDYVKFLDHLIDAPRDVANLRYCGIIRNLLGDDAAVSTMFNKLGNGITISEPQFIYKNVFKEVNNCSCNRWKKWMTDLKKKYFNSPWSVISFLAALVLLILTFVQTIFSILQYVK